FLSSSALRVLPSFPTRRSSDLVALLGDVAGLLEQLGELLELLERLRRVLAQQLGDLGRIDLVEHVGVARALELLLKLIHLLQLLDRKSTRLNSSHVAISYAVFC